MLNRAINSKKRPKIVLAKSIMANMDKDFSVFERIRQGDEFAFELLFKKYYLRLCHYVYKYADSMPDAEELVQDTFLSIWEKRESIIITTSIKSYIYQSVKNRGLNAIRNRNRRNTHLTVINNTKAQTPEALDSLNVEDINDKLFTALDQLPPRCKSIFEMSRIQGLKHKEIAAQMNIKIKTVENQIGIALKYLKVHLSEYLHFIAFLFSIINS